MWSSWSLLGLVQIITNRYGKSCWKFHQLIHSMFGTITTCATIAAAALMINDKGFYIGNLHSAVGFFTFLAVILLGIGGMVAGAGRAGVCNYEWKTKLLLRLGLVHKAFGYLIILATQFCLFTGFWLYGTFTSNNTALRTYAGLNVGIFFGALIVFEILHQLFIRKTIALETPDRVMKLAEFEKLVWEENKKLVLIDDCVVDVEQFEARHPGGTFLIKHHIGRDISKYFHGGYSLEGNLAGPPARGHLHSNYARKIVN